MFLQGGSRSAGFYRKTFLIQNIRINENYYTHSLMLLVKLIMCSKFHWQKLSNKNRLHIRFRSVTPRLSRLYGYPIKISPRGWSEPVSGGGLANPCLDYGGRRAISTAADPAIRPHVKTPSPHSGLFPLKIRRVQFISRPQPDNLRMI